MRLEDLPTPAPASGEVLVRVNAAGVGVWDAWIRSGRSVVQQPLPLTLGSDVAGVVDAVGTHVSGLTAGNEVYGVTNQRFTGGYAEFAIASASSMALKPLGMSFIEAASLPVTAATAWQMLFDHAKAIAGQRVLILGAAGNVGALAVQLAHHRQLQVIAAISSDDGPRMRQLGAVEVVNVVSAGARWPVSPVDVVIDAAGGEQQRQAISLLKPGGILVSSVSPPDPKLLQERGASGHFLLVDTTTWVLDQISGLFAAGALKTHVGSVLPLESARTAHQMIEGSLPYPRGKIVLDVTPLKRPASH